VSVPHTQQKNSPALPHIHLCAGGPSTNPVDKVIADSRSMIAINHVPRNIFAAFFFFQSFSSSTFLKTFLCFYSSDCSASREGRAANTPSSLSHNNSERNYIETDVPPAFPCSEQRGNVDRARMMNLQQTRRRSPPQARNPRSSTRSG